MKRFASIGMFFLMLRMFSFSGWAQVPSTGAQLGGTVLDPSGAVVKGAILTLRSERTNLEQTTQSDGYGQYRFLLVPAGQYVLTVDASGFAKLTNTGITLTVGEVATLTVTLQVAAAQQEVVVTADAAMV